MGTKKNYDDENTINLTCVEGPTRVAVERNDTDGDGAFKGASTNTVLEANKVEARQRFIAVAGSEFKPNTEFTVMVDSCIEESKHFLKIILYS